MVAVGEGKTGAPLRGGITGVPWVSRWCPAMASVHRFSTCSSWGLLLAIVADPSWPPPDQGKSIIHHWYASAGRTQQAPGDGAASPAQRGWGHNRELLRASQLPPTAGGSSHLLSQGISPKLWYCNKQTEQGSRMVGSATEIAGTRYGRGSSPRKDKTQRNRWGSSRAGEQGTGES